jgi:hypothetical protein
MKAMVPIEEAVAILGRVAASQIAAETDESALHLRVTRALDAFAARGLPLPPERIVPRIAGSFEDPAQSVLDLLVTVIVDSDRCASAVVTRAREWIASTTGLPEEAARAHAIRRVLLDPADAIGRYLPRDAVMQNDFRREELIRAWAAAIGVPIEAGGKPEAAEKSERALARLDYRRIRDDEERLAIERRVLAEHTEAVREKQRRDAEAALASAQRE